MKTLVLADHDNTTVSAATRATVTAARVLGGEIAVLIAGENCGRAVQSAAAITSVARVLWAEAPHYAEPLAEDLAELLVAHAAGFTHVISPGTALGKACLPRVAAMLDVGQVSEVVQVLAPDTFLRPVYGGFALATIQCLDEVKVLTVRAAAFAESGLDGNATVERIPALAPRHAIRVVARQRSAHERARLETARAIVSGGRAFGSPEAFRALLEPLADRLGAAIGATRAAVDAGFADNSLQIGQTAKNVAPELYLAIGLSGAIQHVAGIKDSKLIVAINKDATAPIFEVADYGLVGDLFEIVPALTAELA